MALGRPLGKAKALPIVGDVEPTRPLDLDEAEIWARWKAVVRATRQFLATDGPLLTWVVELETRKATARATVAKEGHYIGARRHPALTDADNAQRDLMALLRELGLTPASQKNVRAERRAKEVDDLGEFLAGK